MISQSTNIDIVQIIEKIFTAIEAILPFLIPIMTIALPIVSGLGIFLKRLVEPLYNSIDVTTIDYSNPNFTLIYILGGIGLGISIFVCLKWPNRSKWILKKIK